MQSHFKHLRFNIFLMILRTFLIHWVLTLAIILWRFGSPLRFQIPKWKFPWECEGSFPHTFLHSRASSWPTILQTLALVVSPRLRFRHLFLIKWVTKVNPNINSIDIHPKLSNYGHPCNGWCICGYWFTLHFFHLFSTMFVH
jgi:hypothetical protein